MNYPSIRIEGTILSHDILERIEDMRGQMPIDFGFDSSSKVKDEIARAWADAQDYWRIFQRKLENLKPDSAATTETRQQWIVPLLGLLGYQLEYQPKGTELNGKIYNISHIASNRSQAPVQIIGYREPAGLDRKPERSNLRMSAHAIVQEFLNLNDQLYGLVTNGRVLRLLRDSSRLIKLSYLEFDLDRIFTDGLFTDFAILYRLLHTTRLPVTNDSAAESLIERYHQDTIEQGTRIREGLRAAVTEALEILGTGFVAHPENCSLREQIDAGALERTAFFSHLLRLIYRLLFLNVVEERGLIFPKGTPATRLRTYFDYYSVQRLRRLARTRGLKTERHHDAWLSLLSTFQLFERPEQATKLGTTAFGGQLFDPKSLGPLSSCRLTNAALFDALDRLCSFDDPKTRQRLPVNFGALATEEFGSVYEGLLELHPVIETAPSPHFSFKESAGNDRKTSGSYYTPTSLVDSLLDSALDPVIDDRINKHAALGYPTAEAAILAVKVCDPACGSGHFLIAAAQRMARRLAQIHAGGDEPSPDQLRHALREVIGRCIYAVDINPMSVELCRVALWLEAVEPGKPLSFLDHHIRLGNSLLGATPELIAAGLPDETFAAIEGDDKKACAVLKKRNKAERDGQGPLFAEQDTETQAHLQQAAAELDALPDDRPEEIRAKELAFRHHEETEEYRDKKELADAWCAAFAIKKHFRESGREASASGITQGHLKDLASGRSLPDDLAAEVERLSGQYQFLHWHLAFPEVFAKGGFDVMLGNPPWEKINLRDDEFFLLSHPEIANAQTKAARKRLIDQLALTDPTAHSAYQEAQRSHDVQSNFFRGSGAFPKTGVSRINLYSVFAESGLERVSPTGRLGFVIASGIATDDNNKDLFAGLVADSRLISVWDFENRNAIFPDVHRSYKFCLFCAGGVSVRQTNADLAFFLNDVTQLAEEDRHFVMSPDEFRLVNPKTSTCPIFRSRRDAELAKLIYTRVPALCRHEVSDFWPGTPKTAFNMANDSHLFLVADTLRSRGGNLEGNCYRVDSELFLPLFEAKMLWHFDHRWSSFIGEESHDFGLGEKIDCHLFAQPRYWLAKREVIDRFGDWKPGWQLGYRRVTGATNERTAVVSIFPFSGVGHTITLIRDISARNAALLTANASAFVFDYTCRQKVSGTDLTITVFEQLPTLPADRYLADWPAFILRRVLELTYVAWDLEPFAQDCGWSGPPFRWDEERRFLLRCELDAAFFHLYMPAEPNGDWRPAESETEEDLGRLKAYFLTPRDAVGYIMDTFPIVKRKNEEKWGEYRTKRVILEIYDALAEASRTGQPYQTRLGPPPGDARCCHPPRNEKGASRECQKYSVT